MNPEMLERCCAALFGSDYALAAANFFEVDRKTIWRWRRGRSRVPPAVRSKLRLALVERTEGMMGLLRELESLPAPKD